MSVPLTSLHIIGAFTVYTSRSTNNASGERHNKLIRLQLTGHIRLFAVFVASIKLVSERNELIPSSSLRM